MTEGNGTLRRWVLGVVSTLIASLLGAATYSHLDLRERVALMEGQKSLPERVIALERKVAVLERDANAGARFTKQDGEKLENRIHELEREMRGVRRRRG